jgi:DNA-binding NarL/FixJ family response regulator
MSVRHGSAGRPIREPGPRAAEVRVLLADDHALFRDGLASLLAAWGHDVVGQVADGDAAVLSALELRPDLVLMDVSMPGSGGLDATRRIAGRAPGLPIVMLTASEDVDDLFAALKAGARGYLLKNLESSELRTMLDAVARGEAAITPAIAARILAELARVDRPADAPIRGPDHLTDRELDVLRLVVDGLRNKEIAAALGVSENTVKFHLRNILDKLHAQNRAEVVARAMREGLLADH